MSKFFVLLLLLIGGPTISVFWGGHVLSVLWGWFVVPLGVAPITYLHAAGLWLTVGALLGSRGLVADLAAQHRDDHWDRLGQAIGWLIVLPGLSLIFGAIVHSFM